MPAEKTDDQVAKDLCEKLKHAELTGPERELLTAALKIAVDVTSPEPTLDAEFHGCFRDGDASWIKAYHGARPEKSDVVSGISKSFENGISNFRLPLVVITKSVGNV